jgi:DNA-binding NarL/FixJ family response regulator
MTVLMLSDDATRARRIESLFNQRAELPAAHVQIHPLRENGTEAAARATGLLVIDAQDGNLDPLYWLKLIRQANPSAPILLIAASADPLLASRALRAGATAFLAPGEVTNLIDQAIEHIALGERFVSEDIMQGILHGMADTTEDENRLPVETLSDREMVVFQLLGKGKPVGRIAQELGVNIKTVATHCNNIRRKLRTPDNRHLTRLSQDWVTSRSGVEALHDS